jgi:hypothetical protein
MQVWLTNVEFDLNDEIKYIDVTFAKEVKKQEAMNIAQHLNFGYRLESHLDELGQFIYSCQKGIEIVSFFKTV